MYNLVYGTMLSNESLHTGTGIGRVLFWIEPAVKNLLAQFLHKIPTIALSVHEQTDNMFQTNVCFEFVNYTCIVHYRDNPGSHRLNRYN